MSDLPDTTPSTLFAVVKALNIPFESHYSDLYIPVTIQTAALISRYSNKHLVTAFRSNVDHRMWYDVPFAYMPYWEEKFSRKGV